MIINPCSEIVVGVTQRIDIVEGRAELRDALDQRLMQWLVQAGFLPVAIPNALLEMNAPLEGSDDSVLGSWLQALKPRALVLSGGNDIGEHPQRDATERYLLFWACANKVPVLGICRGLQMMAVWAGGDLVPVVGHVRTRHQLSLTSSPAEWPVSVNSYHNWGIFSCPPQFKVVAHAEDGGVEAVRHMQLPWEGWMWHPEREPQFDPVDTMRIQRLFSGKQ